MTVCASCCLQTAEFLAEAVSIGADAVLLDQAEGAIGFGGCRGDGQRANHATQFKWTG
jgi:hypothetical protein